MPGHAETATVPMAEPVVASVEDVESLPEEPALIEPVASNGDDASAKKGRKREPVTPAGESLPMNNGEEKPEPTVGP